jgi:hypothetical protein
LWTLRSSEKRVDAREDLPLERHFEGELTKKFDRGKCEFISSRLLFVVGNLRCKCDSIRGRPNLLFFESRTASTCAHQKSHSAVFTNVHCYIALKTCHNINSPGTGRDWPLKPTIRQVNAYLPSRHITGQCWMNIRLVHAGMVNALEVRFDFSDRKTSAPGTNSLKLPCSPPAPVLVLACRRARIPSIARQNTCDLLRGCR